ncbi:hypothetical protein AAFC00_000811 [Neodothiora populina]|uniref:FAD-binding PCMH-type domain-containing protein n=1 Tax=Neodothiora populina TaxID=2781224 RepID=A0ABR3PLU8_9PEZI
MAIVATSVNYCCDQLLSALGPSVISFPGNASYQTTESSYWSIQEASLTPTCIATPLDTNTTGAIIHILSSLGPSCQLAIKSQGHAPAAGFANIEDGVTIDITGLNQTVLSADEKVVSVGTGASWSGVYDYLDPYGLVVAGGRNGAVGVGGLTLGGGISYFSPRVGYTCDTVTNFEVVLAHGKVVNANASVNSDLFRALKGGAGNFGLVTRVDLATIPQGNILGGSVAHNTFDREAVFKAFTDIAGAINYDQYASVVTSISFNSTSKGWSVASTPVYTGPNITTNATPPVYQELLAVPQLSNTIKVTNASTFSAEPAIPPLNWLFETGTYGVSASLMSQFFDICNSTLYDFDAPAGWVVWSLAFEPFPTAITAKGAGANVLGTSPADGNSMILLISPLWTSSNSSTLVTAKDKELLANLDAAADKIGLLHKFQYTNYAGPWQQPLKSYGWKNYGFLKGVSKRYDPKGFSQRQVPGGFKLH